jgi:hypothetical protein
MAELKNNSFEDRRTAAAEAKKALLAKFKPKPAVTDPAFEERIKAREAELEAVRQQRNAERQAKRDAAQREEEARQAELAIDQEARELELRAVQKAARDARYAARKQRRG